MKNNCNIRISTVQWDISPEPVVEEAPATYKKLAGSWYACYRVSSGDDDTASTRTVFTFDGTGVEIRRSGAINGSVSYISGKKTKTAMDLGFSEICIENDTFAIKARAADNAAASGTGDASALFSLSVEYDLYLNGSRISRCTTSICLMPW